MSLPGFRSFESGRVWVYSGVMHPKDVDGMTNSVDPAPV